MALARRCKVAEMLVLALAGTCVGMYGQTPGPDYIPTKLDLYTATSDLWRTDRGFQSAIRLKNMLAITEMDVNVTL